MAWLFPPTLAVVVQDVSSLNVDLTHQLLVLGNSLDWITALLLKILISLIFDLQFVVVKSQ